VVASAAIHGLIIVSLWSELPQYMTRARHAYVMVEIVPTEPAQAPSAHHMKTTVVSVHSHPHPVKSSTVEKRTPDFTHIHTSAPVAPPSNVMSTQTVKAVQPVYAAALTSSSPVTSRQAQGTDQKKNRNIVRNHLEVFKYYPASARRRGIEGDVDVSFKLVSGGHAEQVKVLKGSGYAVLDRAAVTTVARAQPFPVENGQFRFHLRFRRL